MRLGCGGCLGSLLALGLAGGLLAGAAWGVVRSLQDDGVPVVPTTPDDGARAQQKIFEVARGTARATVVLTEPELNAFLTRHVDPRDMPLADAAVLLRGGDVVEVTGRLPLRRLVAESPLGGVADALPAAWLARPVRLRFVAHVRVEREPRPQLRLDVRQAAVGRQRVPAMLLRVLLEPSTLRFLSLPLPPRVEEIRVERGRVLIRPTSPRART